MTLTFIRPLLNFAAWFSWDAGTWESRTDLWVIPRLQTNPSVILERTSLLAYRLQLLVLVQTPSVRKDVTMFAYQFLLIVGVVLTTITALDIKRDRPLEDSI